MTIAKTYRIKRRITLRRGARDWNPRLFQCLPMADEKNEYRTQAGVSPGATPPRTVKLESALRKFDGVKVSIGPEVFSKEYNRITGRIQEKTLHEQDRQARLETKLAG